jgi:predicted CoA-binding protein
MSNPPQPTAAVVGASAKPERTSNQAVRALLDGGWTVWPVHPSGIGVHGLETFRSLSELPGRPMLVTMYLNPAAAVDLLEEIVAAGPEWLFLNPGADGEPMASAARDRGLQVVEACTLVALMGGDLPAFAKRVLSE